MFERTQDAIKILTAYMAGESIECFHKEGIVWQDISVLKDPEQWNFSIYTYRIKTPTKPSIDWSIISHKYNWLAKDEDGELYLYMTEPKQDLNAWDVEAFDTIRITTGLISLQPGTCDWKDSLVKRPGYEEGT